jgi:3-dehydroquinate synthetase
MGNVPDHHVRYSRVPVGPGTPAKSSFDPRVIDFGHYAGHAIAELANSDPDYLHWLARHPAGARYRAEISRVLGVLRSPNTDTGTAWRR